MHVAEQRVGDVREDHRSLRADACQRLEADEPVSRADVQQRRALQRLGVAEHALEDRGQPVADRRTLALVTGVAALEQPARPAVGLQRHYLSLKALIRSA